MLSQRFILVRLAALRRLVGVRCATDESFDKKRLSRTVFLPKTQFQTHVKSASRSRLDSDLQEMGGFDELYQWQLNAKERANLPSLVNFFRV
jgi:hypothetical protein